MQAFRVSDALHSLRGTYPPAEDLLLAARVGGKSAQCAIARLWLSEGIPFAFKHRPSIYEALRSWLAGRLRVHEKEVTVIGSGRLGFALIDNGVVGREFGRDSDLDLTIISLTLFNRLADDFRRWADEYSRGIVSPQNDKQRCYWPDNLKRGPINLEHGFIDPHKIPLWNSYPDAKTIAQALYLAGEKLKLTPDAPNVRKLSVRVYRDWESFIAQMALNLKDVAQQWQNVLGAAKSPD